tara:strand:+ start:2320 stop:2616 length:297 start_codon:yes stop_codon:yes gene_type:complete
MTDDENRNRYMQAAHAMQSGVAIEMNMPHRQKATEPKHLRVGINCAMSDHGGLVRLLISKGVITESEYLSAIADAMEEEAAKYQASVSQHFGREVKLA